MQSPIAAAQLRRRSGRPSAGSLQRGNNNSIQRQVPGADVELGDAPHAYLKLRLFISAASFSNFSAHGIVIGVSMRGRGRRTMQTGSDGVWSDVYKAAGRCISPMTRLSMPPSL